jgi:outer membrane receptor protein involved in Fe transport
LPQFWRRTRNRPDHACGTGCISRQRAAAATPIRRRPSNRHRQQRRIAVRLQDVPLSIVALTGKDLEERGITSLVDLSLLTPGLSYSTDFGRTGERPVVRGISVTRLDAPQPVSVFIDGVYVRDGVLSLGIDDAQRIEVIKGPQSALYGRATYAGAINYVTVKPGNVLSGKVTTTVAEDGERASSVP